MEYTDIDNADVAYPYNHEDDMDFYSIPANAIKRTTIRAILDWDLGKAEPYDVQTWIYDDLATTGIGCAVPESSRLTLAFKDGKLLLLGSMRPEDVRIYDMNGSMVFGGMCRGEVNISDLPAGLYVAVSNGVAKKFRK